MATSMSLPHVAEKHKYCSVTWRRCTDSPRAPLSTATSTRSSSKYEVSKWPTSTRESLSAQIMQYDYYCRAAVGSGESRATRCRCVAVPLANWLYSLVRHSHTSRVSESFMWHTLCGKKSSAVSVHVAQVAGVVATHTDRSHHSVLVSARNSSSRAEL